MAAPRAAPSKEGKDERGRDRDEKDIRDSETDTSSVVTRDESSQGQVQGHQDLVMGPPQFVEALIRYFPSFRALLHSFVLFSLADAKATNPADSLSQK